MLIQLTLALAALPTPLTPAQENAGAEGNLEVVRSGTQTELWADGIRFHTTSAAVASARLIRLEGSERFVVTWSEAPVEGEATTPWYAIANGDGSFARVKPTDYTVKLRRARFDPLAEGAPDLSVSPFPGAGRVFVVQFATQPLQEYLDALAEAGVGVRKFVANHAYLMELSPEAERAVAALPFVRWMGGYHGEYRVEPELLQGLLDGSLTAVDDYDIQVFEHGLEQKREVAEAIAALGGTVEPLTDELSILTARLTPSQLLAVTGMDQVLYVDRYGEPESDMNITREFGDADYVEVQTGWSGEDVRGEIMDVGLFTGHADFQHNGGVLVRAPGGAMDHGTPCTGIIFGDGTANASWRGLLPDGKIVFHTNIGVKNSNRLSITKPLVDPMEPYQCVFQSNSWGTNLGTTYNNASTVMDSIIFQTDLLILQSQSNTGTQSSRPQAWAKNIVSVGGIVHLNTLSTADDFWSGASVGPAEDGRIKPDLAHFYDSVRTTSETGGYTQFSGTSAATPITAGYAGLFYQMWHENAFGNNPTGTTVFESRPHASTAKAALITTAVPWTFSGTQHNLTRVHQGWGAADAGRLYDLRDKTFFVDQTDVIDNLATVTYRLTVPAGEPELRATLTWPERSGTTSAAQHRLNDLDLKLTEPDGTTFYYGSRGLKSGLWSTPGGSPKDFETVEPVFVQNPTPGVWTLEVIAEELTDDIVATVPGLNAVYSLWVVGVSGATTDPIAYCTAGTSASGCAATLTGLGLPSATTSSGFVLDATGVEGAKDGLFFFGSNGRQANVWGNGTSFQCVVPPVKRAGLLNGNGSSGACDGTLTQDLNAYWCPTCPASHKNPGAGAQVQAQLWYRDPLNTSNQTTSLSNAIEFTLTP